MDLILLAKIVKMEADIYTAQVELDDQSHPPPIHPVEAMDDQVSGG